MTASVLLNEAESRGVTVRLTENGTLKLRGPAEVIELLQPKLASAKPEIVAELQRRIVESEWRVECEAFVVVHSHQEDAERGACLSCGGSWELHGSPSRDVWKLVDNIAAVEHAATRFVVAQASALLCDKK